MVSALLLVQARRSAGLSQRDLAARAGVAQQEIARYERGRVMPSLERLRALVAACGLELTVGLTRADDSYDRQIAAALALAPTQRLERALCEAEPLRAAQAQAAGVDTSPVAVDVLRVFAALQRARVAYVLIGDLGEVLRGSPLLPLSPTVVIVPRAGQRERLSAAIACADGRAIAQVTPTSAMIDAPSRYALEGCELLLAPAPAATQGYEDLRRDATVIQLDENISVNVASLVDLVRIAEASDERSHVPALRRTLELANAAPSVRAA